MKKYLYQQKRNDFLTKKDSEELKNKKRKKRERVFFF